MKTHFASFLFHTLLGLAGLLLVSCKGTSSAGMKADTYDCPCYRPKNPSAVRVKVSLSKQMVYVMEGDRPLLVTATCVGTPSNPTPRGNFRAYKKIARKRSGSYGLDVRPDGQIWQVKRSAAKGRYVGHPMPWWVEFSPAYGFHEGWVWPVPRSHGCLRLHKNVAPKFYALVKEGTPINISYSQPEDATLGANHKRPGPEHYNAPDYPNSVLITDVPFKASEGKKIWAD